MLENEEAVTQPGQEGQQLLVAVHNHLRDELEQLRQLIRDVRRGATGPGEARSYLNKMAMRQNYWTLGAFCANYCRVLSTHHAIEDQRMFPDLRRGDESLGPVLDRLAAEHEVIAGVLDEVDRAGRSPADVADELPQLLELVAKVVVHRHEQLLSLLTRDC